VIGVTETKLVVPCLAHFSDIIGQGNVLSKSQVQACFPEKSIGKIRTIGSAYPYLQRPEDQDRLRISDSSRERVNSVARFSGQQVRSRDFPNLPDGDN
jgi:hypothetical protein